MKLLGSASISQDNGFIQIPDPSPTVNHAYQAGRAIYSSPIRLFDPLTITPASFQTTFSFQFTTAATNKSYSGNGGLAFLIVPEEFTLGRPGPWLGILNDACEHYKVFAVEFDNSHDPKFGDPNDHHVGVNLGSVVSFKTANASLHDDSIHRAWITYDGHRKWIDIYFGVDGDPVPSQPILSTPLNLSPFLKEYMFVGFSASTGDSPQLHNILSWNFSSTIQAFLNVPLKHICHRNVAHQVSKYSSTINHTSRNSFMIFMCVVALCTMTFLNFYCSCTKRSETTESSMAFSFPDKKQRPHPPSRPRRFAIIELYMATKRFSKMEVLARESRGVLYRGTLPNGCHVAVKRFSNEFLDPSNLKRTRVLLKRISSITQVCCHPGLAPIRGWCFDDRMTILVYDYYQNGSLDRWLFGLGVLPWSRRFKLIKDIGETLSFLHSKELTHGNVKSSSVFLDINYNAVLGDYGFVFFQGKPSKKAVVLDVFGFGMLVLEIVAGKRTIEREEEEEEMGVLEFAWSMHEKGEMVKVVDERMGRNVNSEEAIRVLEIGLSCSLSEINNGRPSMADVVQFFNMMNPVRILPSSRPAQLLPQNTDSSIFSP
ncbi:hypothetical protein JRO89_XS13G0041900 [Xanthoceras sorbifolium]|uniref:Protein kinase domain-containing protein n=1 Tax=Xanthoceras sorbifolium TaxID=99658 RepID=A0ABQ8H6H7_9ROSI|nr:hypothetical protein JRO89_XS13G0041900 [Xanthoceras sorbifolium]